MRTVSHLLVLCSLICSSYETPSIGISTQSNGMNPMKSNSTPRHFLKNGVDDVHTATEPDFKIKDGDLTLVLPEMEIDVQAKNLIQATLRRKRTETRRTKRLITTFYQWPKAVVIFDLDPAAVRPIVQQAAEDGMAAFEKFTCFRFYPLNSTIHDDLNLGHKENVTVIDTNRGCFVTVLGYQPGYSMQVDPCTNLIIALHEFGHVIGVFHEQLVENRDLYLDTRLTNIYTAFVGNYLKGTPDQYVDTLSTAYDEESVMHYRKYDFTSVGYTTFLPYRQDIQDVRTNAWYLFKEVNLAYNCYSAEYGCTGPVPECLNDGYPAVYEGRCQCNCPEGLDPDTRCATLLPGVCGEIIHLTKLKRFSIFRTPMYPSTVSANTTCVWIVKAPPGDKVAINIADLVVPGNFTGCQSTFRIKRHLLGQIGITYCGEGFQKTILSVDNTVALVLQTRIASTAKLRGTAVLLSSAVNCYSFDDRGATYNGPVNRATDNSKCLSWTETIKCRRHPFYKYVLEGSYSRDECRNPGGVLEQPWCFTDINGAGCTIKLCDACGYGRAFDSYDNCDILTGGSSSSPYCQTEEGQFGCRRTCNLRNQALGSRFYCVRPGYVPGGRISSRLRWFYPMGSSVTYTCIYNTDVTVQRFCLSDGTWTEIRAVCVARSAVSKQCPEGFEEGPKNLCYTNILNTANKTVARDACQSRGASILTIKSPEENDWIKEYKIQTWYRKFIYLGSVFVNGTWIWEDTLVPVEEGYTNWVSGFPEDIPDGECSMVMPFFNNFEWNTTLCNVTRGVICQRPKETVEVPGQASVFTCRDSKRDCQAMLEKLPDMCNSTFLYKNYCQRTCGRCGLRGLSCEVATPSPSSHVRLLTPVGTVNPGDTAEYECDDGLTLDTGDILRACKLNGTLTGVEPVCRDLNNTVTWLNSNEIREMQFDLIAGTTMLGPTPFTTFVRSGFIQRVKAYCADPGEILFYICSNTTINSCTVEGVNSLQCDRNRVMTWDIPLENQIQVEPGNFLGVLDPGGRTMTYSICEDVTLGGKMNYIFFNRLRLTEGYTFSINPPRCRMIPINAEIRPLEVISPLNNLNII